VDNQQDVKNSYRLVHRLGKGSIGEVHKAIDTQTNQTVAIKLIDLPSELNDVTKTAIIHQFHQSARLAGTIKHPNMAAVIDSGKLFDKPFIAYELCKGITLRDYLKYEKEVPQEKLKDIACKVLSALTTAHNIGISHGHINPKNIMILENGDIKLMDMGLSGLDYALKQQIPGYTPVITPYTSPEEVLGRNTDARSDLFSLASSLYECFAGKPAFPGTSPNDISLALTQVEPISITNTTQTWNVILKKAMAKAPGIRYQSAAQMKDDIQSDQTPTTVQNASSTQQPMQQSYQPSPIPPPVAQQSQPDNSAGWIPSGTGQLPSDPASNQPPNTPQINTTLWDYLLYGRYRNRYGQDDPPPQFGMNISALSMIAGITCIILLVIGYPGWANLDSYPSSRHYAIVWEPWNIICMLVGVLLAIIAGISLRRDLRG